MSTERKLVLVACAAIAVLTFAVFSLRQDAEVPPPLAETLPAAAASRLSATPFQAAPVDSPASSADYFPLSDGFLLTYLAEVSHKGDPPRFGIAKTTVEGRETIRGKEYYKVLLRITGIREMSEPVLRYCRQSSDAWQEVDAKHKSDPTFEAVALPLPPQAGVRWDKETPEERSNWRVEGTETVSLLGKQYPNCLRIAYERWLKDEPEYFETGHCFLAPNIGLIKQVASAAGTRISFTLDDREPEVIAFYTTWAGTYEGTYGRGGPPDGSIRLSADGRYAIKKPRSDGGSDAGRFERHPTRQGELIFRSDDGYSNPFSFRETRGQLGTILHLKGLSPSGPPELEYLRGIQNK
jgi:hypothetical protein